MKDQEKQSQKPAMSRRGFLSLGAATGTIALTALAPKALAMCGLKTPSQTAGPFYPGEAAFTQTQDLTEVPGAPRRALGEVIYVKGRVLDANCQPIHGANVEIWQACESGKYNNPLDPNPAAIDPYFRYWSEAFTNAQGEYMFKTIVPGAYPASPTWTRPPHIHFKISAVGYWDLVTQMYFKGSYMNDHDAILQRTPANQRESLIVEFLPSPEGFEPGSSMGEFNITMESVI